MHLAILTRQIGHYHGARYRETSRVVDALTVLSVANEGEFPEFLARDISGFQVERLFPNRGAYDEAVAAGRMMEAVASRLTKIAPNAVAVSGWTNPESVAAIYWARRQRVPIVLMSESQADDAPRQFVRETIKRRIVSLCDAALVGGPPHARYVSALGIPSKCVHLGYNAVDNQHFAAGADRARADAERLRAQHGLPDRYVLASARFIPKKNLATLVKAYAVAAGGRPDAPHLVILGDGETRSEILAAIAESGLGGRVHLPGFRGYDVLPIYYGLADAFVHVSRVEQWGLVVNEAMAAGLPVIVSEPCGVARSVVDAGQSGWRVAPEIEPIAAALANLFSLGPAEREAMGRRARLSIQDWGPDKFAAGMRAAIADASRAPSRRPAPWDRAILWHMSKKVTASVA